MLNRIDIEYLKRVNAVRKRMGLALDSEQVNKHAFLDALAQAKHSKK